MHVKKESVILRKGIADFFFYFFCIILLTKSARRRTYNQIITEPYRMAALYGVESDDMIRNTGGFSYVDVTIYIDVLWLRTYFVELMVCIFLNLWMKQVCPVGRILWMSAFAVSVEVLLFVLAGFGTLFAVSSLALRIFLLMALFRPKSRGIFLRLFLWSLLMTVAAGGILFVCQEYLPQRYWFAVGSICCALSVMGSLILEDRRIQHDRNLYQIKLCNGEKQVEVIGLHDTGNRLRDPYVHAPVHILAYSEAQMLSLNPECSRLIPFSTVGAPQGLLEAWTIDVLEWANGTQEHVVIGVAEDALFAGKDYRLILAAGWNDLS